MHILKLDDKRMVAFGQNRTWGEILVEMELHLDGRRNFRLSEDNVTYISFTNALEGLVGL